MEQQQRIRRWHITFHNYQSENWTKESLIQILTTKWDIDYMIIGEELTEENKIPHYQMYIEFTNPTTLTQVIERFNKITKLKPHIEDAKGDAQQNKNYCSKNQNFLEHGQITKKLNIADVAVNIIMLLNQGVKLVDIMVQFKEYTNYCVRNFNNLMKIQDNIPASSTFRENKDEGDIPF